MDFALLPLAILRASAFLFLETVFRPGFLRLWRLSVRERPASLWP